MGKPAVAPAVHIGREKEGCLYASGDNGNFVSIGYFVH